jgi:hypothetical protein
VRVTEVSAVVRYSAEAKGAWRSIEMGAATTLTNSDETLESAQAELCRRLGQQLKTLWSNGSSKPEVQEPPRAETPSKEHWCSEHNQEWKLRNGPHGSFRSHQITGSKPTQWCNQPNT